ncbi:NAD-dependent epimerase/dehydratase family protein [Shewanella sp. AS1]|uniref:2-alkyl-3-oxoalkanoate reductase n=1 Tax=Shewanella sp. AS1 TaxID=2907626 RepID=UPI001F2FDDB1|nr:2-alkyl-3-oxoalkanoate reductase [Shewanella sp. AS1]MCE9678946.1 NAD-dependent epimerase/dehydratase family protein [Shewanella sp. AS1]
MLQSDFLVGSKADLQLDLHPKETEALTQLAANCRRVAVTGAGGFLGRAICERLLSAGIEVIGLARGDYPDLHTLGVKMIPCDIADSKRVSAALSGCDLVFHVASKAGVWGDKASFYLPNVSGCDNIIQACIEHNISKLVYTSTPSVTFAGVDEAGIDESAPYAETYLNYYGESKAIAEQRVMAANGRALSNGDQLKTVSLRPHLIWGPRDPHLVPRVLERARSKRLKLVGKKDKLVDTIFIANAAYAHILAANQLVKANSPCAGKAYFLSNDEPITMASMLNKILSCADLPPVTKRVPARLAYAVGALLEFVYGILGKQDEPIMTRFVARQLSTSHYFDIGAAKRDLGYQPFVSIDEGMVRLSDWLKQGA